MKTCVYRLPDSEKLKLAIRYLADSDVCERVQFWRDPEMCDRHSVDGCEECWREELGRENANK